ncbi:hypothetical protein FGO68_gene8654 [Halteria grandinella]|uniref:Cyclin-like domain-containing protein n=1 Tax=Halteria grandinella TaxID=5974 RepID=A0A8J8T9F0_HALGN|nr:hypothetical protein FGO68_gene8654 [Halteria grandinella]
MKKVTQFESLRPKAPTAAAQAGTASANRKIEQKRIETSVVDDFDDDSIFLDTIGKDDKLYSLLSFDQRTSQVPPLLEKKSSSMQQTATHQEKENQGTLTAVKQHHQDTKKITQSTARQSHHSRTQSANIPYSTNQGRAIHTNIGTLEQTANPAIAYTAHKPSYQKHPFTNHSNNMMVSPSQHGGEYYSAQNPVKYNRATTDKFRTQHSDINEIDEDDGCDYIDDEDTYVDDDVGLENLGAGDEEEMSLGNFYTDLEKQPLVNKYTTLSQREERENTTPLKPTASCSKMTDRPIASASSNAVMKETPSQDGPLGTIEKVDQKMFSNLKTPPVNTLMIDKVTDHFDALEIISPTIPQFQASSQNPSNAVEEQKDYLNSSMNHNPDIQNRCSELDSYLPSSKLQHDPTRKDLRTHLESVNQFTPLIPDHEDFYELEPRQLHFLHQEDYDIDLEAQNEIIEPHIQEQFDHQQRELFDDLEQGVHVELYDTYRYVDPEYEEMLADPCSPFELQQRFQMKILEHMVLREEEYKQQMRGMSRNPLLMFDRQAQVSTKMREILIDWLMEVCEEFMIKRDTLYITVDFLDRYIAMADYDIQKNELQLIGVTALFLACKVEEVYIPRVNDFALATDGGYCKEEILEMEFKMMMILRYKLHPVTMCTWANWYINMWDVYADQQLKHLYPPGTDLTFKTPNEIAYQRYRVLVQILDFLSLSVHTHQYCRRELIACALYIVIGGPHMMGVFPFEYQWLAQVFAQDLPIYCTPQRPFHTSPHIQPDQLILYNSLFDSFLTQCFAISLSQLAPALTYCLQFFTLPLSFELPSAATAGNSDQIMQNNYEEFLAYQTHNKHALGTLKGIGRTIEGIVKTRWV